MNLHEVSFAVHISRRCQISLIWLSLIFVGKGYGCNLQQLSSLFLMPMFPKIFFWNVSSTFKHDLELNSRYFAVHCFWSQTDPLIWDATSVTPGPGPCERDTCVTWDTGHPASAQEDTGRRRLSNDCVSSLGTGISKDSYSQRGADHWFWNTDPIL